MCIPMSYIAPIPADKITEQLLYGVSVPTEIVDM